MPPASEQGLQPDRYQVVPRVLVFVTDGDDVLLLRGALTKRIWPGLLNGLGGHLEAGEDPLGAAIREVREESGIELRPIDLSLRAVISIDAGDPRLGILNFVFTATCSSRKVAASHEGGLEWHRKADLAALPLVGDLPWLLPRLFGDSDNGVLFARFFYDADGKLQIEETSA
jgi:8-oxo-dGTP diphosphatase